MTGRERGQITVLTIGFLVVLGLLTALVVDASAMFLQRRELLNLADRAALTAADGLSRERLYREGVSSDVPIDPAEARRLAAAVLPPDTSLQLRADASGVSVRLEREVDLPLTPPGWASEATIVAESAAALRLAEP